MVIKESVEIEATPEKIWEYAADFDRHYTEASPDHIERVTTVKSMDMEKPDVSFYFKQRSPFSGRVQKLKGKVTRMEPNRVDVKFLFPYSIVLPRYTNIVEPRGDTSIFTAIFYFRFGRLLQVIARKRFEMVLEHLRDELQNMKAIVEG